MDVTTLRSGSQAPDVKLRASDGVEVRMSDLWSQQKTVLVFLRHFG